MSNIVKNARSTAQKVQRSPETVDIAYELNNVTTVKGQGISRCFINNVQKLHTCSSRQKFSQGHTQGHITRKRYRWTGRPRGKGQHNDETELIISSNLGPAIPSLSDIENFQPYIKDQQNPEIDRGLTETFLQNPSPALNVLYNPEGLNNSLIVAKTPITVQLPKLEYSKCSYFTFLEPFLEKPSAMEIIKKDRYKSSFSTLKSLFGPYAQTQVVFNVIEQTSTRMKEQGTSQQFKQKSQGTGSGSILGNDNSSESSKRRTIKIESGCSFSISFIDRGKGASTATSSAASSQEPVPEPTTKIGKKEKKELHRCLCTMSFPTDDKKLKNKPCDPGVCEPGKCTPSECFKRLQEKYGSKKKSTSDVSSSQASQTSKKKERAGKETLVKEKGSSSISQYKETVVVKPLPKEEKAGFAKCITDCCNKLQFWKKDKPIELKPAVIGTDISVKDDKGQSFGSSAATQAGKKADLKGAATGDKATEGGEGDKKVKGKKSKGKKETAKDVSTEAKGKKGDGKEEITTDKIETTDKTTKTGRILKPYECEPGVCSPKVCVPKECYDRKFPPPIITTVAKPSAFQECLRKLCCKKPIGEDTAGGVSAATQSRKSTGAPEIAPGTTVYKDTGQVAKPKKGDKQAIDTSAQPVEGGDVQTDSRRTRKSTVHSGIQYYQSIDTDAMTQRQGVNIGSDCSCSVEFYKMLF